MYGPGFSGSVRWSPKGPGVYKDQRTSVEKFPDVIYNGCDRGPKDRAGSGKFCSGFLRRKTRFLPISGVRGISGRRTEPDKKIRENFGKIRIALPEITQNFLSRHPGYGVFFARRRGSLLKNKCARDAGDLVYFNSPGKNRMRGLYRKMDGKLR